jgi:hypothetical protein
MSIKQVLIAIDQLGNAVLFGGWADETISARAYRESWPSAKYIDILFFWEDDHCMQSYISETERMQLPPEYR